MKNRTYLIADDEVHLVHIVAYNLRKTGATVETASNGLECFDAAAKLLPDLIVSDYQMPTLDGLQACVRLKADPRTAHIPVIMLTARGHRLSSAELAQTNIRAVLPKPFSSKQLSAVIEQVLGISSEGAVAA